MKYFEICRFDELAGKKIKSVQSSFSGIYLLLEDDSLFVLRPDYGYDGEAEIDWLSPGETDELELYTLVDLGLITREGAQEIEREMRERNEKERRKRELAELRRLKQKYEESE